MALLPLPFGCQSPSRRRAIPYGLMLRAAIAMWGLAAVALAASGCTGAAKSSPVPGATSTAIAGASTTPAAPPSTATLYRPIDALCSKLDLRSVADIIGLVGSRQESSRTSGSTANLACTATVGRLPNGVVMTVHVDIVEPDSARLMYEGIRQAQQDAGPVNDLTGVGGAAYTYTDESTGFNLATYDANLYLTIAAAPLRLGAALPGDLPARLVAVATSTLAALRT
ncbi:hypothetical protein ABZ647_30385 [Micromonospora aurantiaca]|uniref:hypothetical protein n=1 Tax=Micromonospora TaxID=1873 RepID=UPI00179E0B92|nr:hypothetical protein [Micromonospora sp. WMMB235]